jgi:hypothetical protein
MPECSEVVRSRTVRMVRSTKVSSNGGVSAMGTAGVTTLHHRGAGVPKLPLHPKLHHPHHRSPRGWYVETATRCAPFLRIQRLRSSPREKESNY